MNFNLISPEGNGFEFTTRFREPIDIDANSKIQLNWAELTRAGKIVLRQPDTFTITALSEDVFPRKVPSGGFADNKVFDNQGSTSKTLTIAAGTYSFSEFADKIDIALQEALDSNGTASADNNLQYYTPNEENFRYVEGDSGQSNFAFGYELGGEYFAQQDRNVRTTFDASGSPQINAAFTGNKSFLKTGGVANTFDAYATDFSKHYFHYQFENAVHDYYKTNVIFMRGALPLKYAGGVSAQQGRIAFSLYSKEYAQGIGSAPPASRTAAALANTALDTDANGIPKAFITLVSGPLTGNVELYVAKNTGEGTIMNWTSLGNEINSMELAWSAPMVDFYGEGAFPAYNFNTYIAYDDNDEYKTSPRLYFRVHQSFSTDTAGDVIYDSKTEGYFLPYALLEATAGNAAGVAYTDAVSINSQIPFNVMLSADVADEGWSAVRFKSFKKDINSNNNTTNPQSIIERYSVTLGSELQKILGFVSFTLHPNAIILRGTDNSINYSGLLRIVNILTNLDVNWKRDNYSIFIDLPISAYKNVKASAQGGFRKAILANLPSPFSTGTIIEPIENETQNVISTYQPYVPIINDLNNNPINVNSIRIKIVDSATENLSSELSNSVINFTITK